MKLLRATDPRLRQPVPPLDLVGDQRWPRTRLGRTIIEMLDLMYHHDGIGLAAPQVGVDAQIIVADPAQDRHQALVLINPTLVQTAGDAVGMTEGCLSLPGQSGQIYRPERCVVRYYDADLFPSELAAEGLLARVLQHELDHLQGILFTDRLADAS